MCIIKTVAVSISIDYNFKVLSEKNEIKKK